jgi:hypothetical protein
VPQAVLDVPADFRTMGRHGGRDKVRGGAQKRP